MSVSLSGAKMEGRRLSRLASSRQPPPQEASSMELNVLSRCLGLSSGDHPLVIISPELCGKYDD